MDLVFSGGECLPWHRDTETASAVVRRPADRAEAAARAARELGGPRRLDALVAARLRARLAEEAIHRRRPGLPGEPRRRPGDGDHYAGPDPGRPVEVDSWWHGGLALCRRLGDGRLEWHGSLAR
jgi:hypothetical protein